MKKQQINEGNLEALGLSTWELGYYNITPYMTIDVEGTVRINETDYVCELRSIDEVELFIKWVNR